MAVCAFGSGYNALSAPMSRVLTGPIVKGVLLSCEDPAVLESVSGARVMQRILSLYHITQLPAAHTVLGAANAEWLGLYVALSRAERRARRGE
jgi:hypothetical protein